MARDETRLEQRIRRHHERGELKEAATAAIEGFGPEILGFLKAVVRDERLAGEVFAQFCEDLWTGLAGFRWETRFRTWGYTLARNAWHRQRREVYLCPGRGGGSSGFGLHHRLGQPGRQHRSAGDADKNAFFFRHPLDSTG